MDWVYFLLAVLGITGAALVILPALFGKADDQDKRPFLGYKEIDERLRGIDDSLSEADNAISELSGASKTAMRELDGKYQELLFLYNLIEEKKRGLETTEFISRDEIVEEEQDEPVSAVKADLPDLPAAAIARIYSNPKLPEILRLKDEGLNVREIAKKLGLGQGEVGLILTLSGTNDG